MADTWGLFPGQTGGFAVNPLMQRQQPVQGQAAPSPSAPALPWQQQPPPGIWDQLTGRGNQAGLAGSPLFRMGLEMMQRSTAGEQGLPGMTEGLASAQASQMRARGEQIQNYQFQQALEAKAKKDAQTAKVNELLAKDPKYAGLVGTGLGADALMYDWQQQHKAFAPTAPTSQFAKITPKDYTPDSVAAFQESVAKGAPDYGLLREPADTGEGVSDLDFGDVQKFRKEFANLPSVAAAQAIYGSAKAVQALGEHDSAVAQLATVISVMKALDPGSVVREGEQQIAKRTGGSADRFIQLFDTLKTGKGLSPKQMTDFKRTTQVLANTALEVSGQKREYFNNLAQGQGIDPYRVTGPAPQPFELGQGAPTPQAPAPPAAVPPPPGANYSPEEIETRNRLFQSRTR